MFSNQLTYRIAVAFPSRSGVSTTSYCSHTLNALPENSDEDLSLTIVQPITTQQETNQGHAALSDNIKKNLNSASNKLREISQGSSAEDDTQNVCLENGAVSDAVNPASSDADSILSSSPSRSDFNKDYEPLKSVQLLRNMSHSLSLYLPKYSLGSDSEMENL